MAQRPGLYTLVGFGEHLDLRPMYFVDGIPPSKICNICSLVPSKNAFLPCRHVVCESCYEQSVQIGGHCVLDGEACPQGDVHWSVFPAESLMKRTVACWNQSSGCDVTSDISSIIKHFHAGCAYHPGRCPNCGAWVLHRDMIAHLLSKCSAHLISADLATLPDDSVCVDMEAVQRDLRDVRESLDECAARKALLNAKITDLCMLHGNSKHPDQSNDTQSKEMRDMLEAIFTAIGDSMQKYEAHKADLELLKRRWKDWLRLTALEITTGFKERHAVSELKTRIAASLADVTHSLAESIKECAGPDAETIQRDLLIVKGRLEVAAAQRGCSGATLTHLSLLLERLKRSKDALPEDRKDVLEVILTLMADIRRECSQPQKVFRSLKANWKGKVWGTAAAINARFKVKSAGIEWTSRLTTSIAYIRQTLPAKIRQDPTQATPSHQIVLSNENSKKARLQLQNLPKSVPKKSHTHLWCLKNYWSLKAAAMAKGWAVYAARNVFSGGHLFRPAVFFRKRGCLAELHMSIIILREHHCPSWPFEEGAKLFLVHPTEPKDCMIFANGEKGGSVTVHPFDSKEGVGMWALVSNAFFSLSDIEGSGYVKEDELNFVLAVLQEAENKPVKKRIVLL